jgi:hypothetical protein
MKLNPNKCEYEFKQWHADDSIDYDIYSIELERYLTKEESIELHNANVEFFEKLDEETKEYQRELNAEAFALGE